MSTLQRAITESPPFYKVYENLFSYKNSKVKIKHLKGKEIVLCRRPKPSTFSFPTEERSLKNKYSTTFSFIFLWVLENSETPRWLVSLALRCCLQQQTRAFSHTRGQNRKDRVRSRLHRHPVVQGDRAVGVTSKAEINVSESIMATESEGAWHGSSRQTKI